MSGQFEPGWAEAFGRELAQGERASRLSGVRETRKHAPETIDRMREAQRLRWAAARAARAERGAA